MENIINEIKSGEQPILTDINSISLGNIEQKINNNTKFLAEPPVYDKSTIVTYSNEGSTTLFLYIITMIISGVILYYGYQYFKLDVQKYPIFANISALLLVLSALFNLFFSIVMIFSGGNGSTTTTIKV